LDVAYEYAALVLNGDCSLEGQPLQERVLYYLGANRSAVCFTSRSGGRLLLVGGPPFPEKILMWWNFVARTPQEIADARTDWEERRRFGEVTGYSGRVSLRRASSSLRMRTPPVERRRGNRQGKRTDISDLKNMCDRSSAT
jgi:hypothetical protein